MWYLLSLSLCLLNGLLWIAPVASVQECQSMYISLPPTFSHMQLVVECSVSTSGGTLNLSGLDFVAIGSPASPPPLTAEVLVFRLPDECAAGGYNDCDFDWTRFGVGATKIMDPPAEDKTSTTTVTSTTWWCCSDDSIDLGLCDESEKGHLLVNPLLFQGYQYHRMSHIPASGNPSIIQHDGSLKNLKSGNYVVLTANCDQHGRAIQVTGALDWSQQNEDEVSVVANSTAAPASSSLSENDTTSRQNADDDDDDGDDDDDDNVFKEEHLPSFGRKVLNIVVPCGVSFLVVGSLIIMYRNREMARWHEYRTHQLLQAQDEAFDTDMTTEELFDLELVEATPGMKMTTPM